MSLRCQRHLPALVILLVTTLTYAGSLDGRFVSDDIRSVQDNPLIRSLDPDHLRRIFTSFDGPNYMPLKVLSLALDVRLFGAGPSGFHVTNLLLHVLCALLLHRLLLRLELGSFAALLAALLWSVHPLQVESVAWISERKNVLSTLFLLAGFRVYLGFSEHGGLPRYLLLVALHALAMLSKMTTMVLPALCLAYELAFRFRVRSRDWLAILPLLAMAAAVAWLNLAGNPVHGLGYHGGSFRVTALTSSVVVLHYLRKIVLPTDLMVYYDVRLHGSLLDPPVLLALALLGGLAICVVLCLRKRLRAGFWVLWFFLTLLPMLNLIPFTVLMQDRYLYVPLVGPLVLLASGIGRVAGLGLPRAGVTGLAALLVAGACAGTIARVEVFDSPLAFWSDWALRTPYLPSESRRQPPDLPQRVRVLAAAIQEHPEAAAPRATLGALYYEAGDTRRALLHLEEALRLEPEDPRILADLGRALARAGRHGEGERMLARAAALAPYDFVTHKHLARVRLERGDVEGARQALATLERLAPAASPTGRRWADLRQRLQLLEAGPETRRDAP